MRRAVVRARAPGSFEGSGDRGARYVILQHNGQESSMDIAQLGGVLLKLTLRNK